jgi:hypothetical protein
MKLRYVGFLALATLLCSCAATSVKHTWKSPDYHGGPATKVAVLAVEERGLLRQGFENRFVADLQKEGVTAFTTFNLLTLSEIKQDKVAAEARFRSAGADVVLILKMMELGSSYREVQTGRNRYALGSAVGSESDTWYSYYTASITDLAPTYGTLRQNLQLETVLFDLKSAKRLWTGVSVTIIKEGMDRVAEMDPIVSKFVAAMRKDGMIP